MTTPHLHKSTGRLPLLSLLIIPLVFTCFALAQTAQAVVTDPQDYFPGGNTAAGQNALFSLTNGGYNTAIGWSSLYSVVAGSGSFNTGVGAGTLVLNRGDENTATGAAALLLNTNGTGNTATGTAAMVYNSSGDRNTANGAGTLLYNYSADDNTAAGYQALYYNDFSGSGMGNQNTAFGSQALYTNHDGQWNCAFGWEALFLNNTGSVNTAFGHRALFGNVGGFNNTAVGRDALSNGDYHDNTAVGWSAGSDVRGSGNIYIGSDVYGGDLEDGITRIGHDSDSGYNACYINGISGANVSSGTAALVYVDVTGKLGTVPLPPLGKNMAVPVPRGAHPKAMLNKSEHGKVAQLQATIAELKATVARQRKDFEAIVARQQKDTQALAAQVKEQASQIQKVSAQLEASKPAPQVVTNP